VLIDFDVEGVEPGVVSYTAMGAFLKSQWLTIRIKCYKKVLPIDIAMVRLIVSKLTDLMMPAEYRASN
jgi:hypothetical protein